MLSSSFWIGLLLLDGFNSQCYEKSRLASGKLYDKEVSCYVEERRFVPRGLSDAVTDAPNEGRGIGSKNGSSSRFNTANAISAANGTFLINLTCQADAATCSEVQYTFVSAAQFLANVLVIKTPITVDARYYSFCTQYQECIAVNRAGQQITLGQATPNRSILFEGDDGKSRMYPQALIKQIDPSKILGNGAAPDILAEFNSDAQFWFQRSNKTIAQNQVDFLLVVSHEMVHGLGFTSSYADYFNEDSSQVLTPNPQITTQSNGQARISGFIENIFDKYIIRTDNKQALTATITDPLNNYAQSSSFASSIDDWYSAFQNSDAFKAGANLLTTATTQNSLALNLNSSSIGPLYLETGLKPFQPSSSISHVDIAKYSNSNEFLMQWQINSGISLGDSMKKIGGQWNTAPYGPLLIQFLGNMGYPTNSNPDPKVFLQFSNSKKLTSQILSIIVAGIVVLFI